MTDWWGNASVIISGIITALASIGAVVYTNFKTKKQLEEQEKKHEYEKRILAQQNKFAIIKPSHRLVSFSQLLDSLIISNDYNRVLLFSGEDGFEFFDNMEKYGGQTLRILSIENKSGNDIKNLTISSNSVLTNVSTNKTITYNTNNNLFLLRNGESIIIRLNNQEQFEDIIEMNKSNCPSDMDFQCIIEYDTMASQTIKYIYQINIRNDRVINVISDGIVSITDAEEKKSVPNKQSCFRNLQDTISHIDRSAYAWRKMGNAQIQAVLPYLPMNQPNPGGSAEKKMEKEQ